MPWRSIMNHILFMMNSDHDAIEQLIVRLNDKSEYNSLILHELIKRFNRHFLWEEQVLFLEFEKNAGVYGKKIVSKLKCEHQQIQKLLNENIKTQIETTSTNKKVNTLSELIEILRMHKEMEQDIFYPWFEKNLNGQKRNQLIEQLKNIYSFGIENK